MNYMETMIRMACRIMEETVSIEFDHVPDDRQNVIVAAATQELTDWLEEKGMTQKERVLTRFVITASMLHVLLDHLPQLKAHLNTLLKEEQEHGI